LRPGTKGGILKYGEKYLGIISGYVRNSTENNANVIPGHFLEGPGICNTVDVAFSNSKMIMKSPETSSI